MKRIQVLCVSPDGPLHEIIGGVVKVITKSDLAHVAMRFENSIIEAVAPKIREHSILDLYDHEPVLRIYDVPVSDEQYKAVYQEAHSWVGKWYSLGKCIVAGSKVLWGDPVSDHLAMVFSSKQSNMCSGLLTVSLRKAFPDFLEVDSYQEITPIRAEEAVQDLINKLSAGHEV